MAESMKRKKTTEKNLSRLRAVSPTRNSMSERKNGEPFLPVLAENGRVWFITDCDVCNTAAKKKFDSEPITVPFITRSSVLPCITDEELRRALRALLDVPEIHVEIAGGIVRHDIR
jgi:hypothetical protein